MDPYVSAGYLITVGSLALYALRLLVRGRSLARAVGDTQDGGR